MGFTLAEIEDMLDALPLDEFRFDKIQEDALTYTGALRTALGQNVIEPSPESASMVIGLKPSIDFLTAAPQIVRQLLDTIEHNKSVATMVKAPDEPEKAESLDKKPISV